MALFYQCQVILNKCIFLNKHFFTTHLVLMVPGQDLEIVWSHGKGGVCYSKSVHAFLKCYQN